MKKILFLTCLFFCCKINSQVNQFDLKNDPKKIQAYIDHHKNVWPEIKESIKNAGINHLEIFHTHNRLFMIIEADKNFSIQNKSKID